MSKNLWKSLTILAFAIWTAGTWNTFPYGTGEELLVCLVVNAVGFAIMVKTFYSINRVYDAKCVEDEA